MVVVTIVLVHLVAIIVQDNEEFFGRLGLGGAEKRQCQCRINQVCSNVQWCGCRKNWRKWQKNLALKIFNRCSYLLLIVSITRNVNKYY
jgi:hypothetical protein